MISKTSERVYQTLCKLSINGICNATQNEIVARVKISRRHLYRMIKELEEQNLVAVFYYWGNKKRYNIYFVHQGSPIYMGHSEGSESPIYMGHESGKCPIHDDMMHDDEKILREKLVLLNFLHLSERFERIKQNHCALDFCRAWRAWWDRRDFGALDNPAGWANAEMKRGHAPPLQMALPEGIMTEDFISRGMTRDEIQAISKNGATLGPDGIWR